MRVGETWHQRHRERLAALRAGDAVLEAVAAVGEGSSWSSGRAWRRTFGRIELDREQYATLVLESDDPQAILLVEAFERRPGRRTDERAAIRVGGVGWLRIVSFPRDPTLTTLPAVVATADRAAVVRYRPYRRCTLRIEERGRARFAKVFADRRGERIHAAGMALWAAVRRGELPFAVPRPGVYSPQTRTVWQQPLAGEPAIAQLYGARGAEIASRMGAAAAALTRSRLVAPATYDAAAQLADSSRKVAELIRLVPRLGFAANELLRELRAAHAGVAGRRPRPIHGAPHANQWLIRGDRLGLVDFDRVALGDPERDAATFIAELDFEDRTSVPVEELTGAFLGGYDDVAGGLDRSLLRAYRAHKRLAKTLRTARALRPDGDERAERHLARAAECLDPKAAVA
ncbi:MAG: phosphotransferase family protein [Solirubrobacterales bacterium]